VAGKVIGKNEVVKIFYSPVGMLSGKTISTMFL
jgi:hypothetical protein